MLKAATDKLLKAATDKLLSEPIFMLGWKENDRKYGGCWTIYPQENMA
jgi:hypothetical protein